MKIAENMLELIGKTPVVKINKLNNTKANIFAKIESFNPFSSVKDRVGLAMIEQAEREGLLKKGGVIVEPTSGNTGIGLAGAAAIKGYKLILTMPETMSIERRKLLKAFGAEIVLTEGSKGMGGAVAKAEELVKEIEGAFMPQQFKNKANSQIHKETTGPELYNDMDGKIDIFISAVGTGGTITGVGEYLKEKNSNIKVVAVEPASSPVLSGGKSGPHKIQGIGAGFVPDVLNTNIYDEIVQITNEEAFDMAKALAANESILAGISSGAAMAAALKIAERPENAGKNIAVILADTGERYLSVLAE
ncbi:MAG: cysteine synthase A [Candidatus Mucispirillum faecigallinarum]|nr:cysteine synthase A [Candidatus Mucispirillum faecigallinarum]